jgi:hypothetical protein
MQQLTCLAEVIEAQAYISTFASIPASLAERYQIQAHIVGSSVALVMARLSFASVETHRVLALGACEPATQETVDSLFELYARLGAYFYVQITPYAQPEDLEGWIRARGMRRGPTGYVYVKDATTPVTLRARPQLRVVQVGEQRAEATQYADGIVAGFGIDGRLDTDLWIAFHQATIGHPNWRHYVLYDETFHHSNPIAFGSMFMQPPIAYLFATSTLREARGRGAHQALIIRRVQDAIAAGCMFVTAETADDASKHSLEKAGFYLAYPRFSYEAEPS